MPVGDDRVRSSPPPPVSQPDFPPTPSPHLPTSALFKSRADDPRAPKDLDGERLLSRLLQHGHVTLASVQPILDAVKAAGSRKVCSAVSQGRGRDRSPHPSSRSTVPCSMGLPGE